MLTNGKGFVCMNKRKVMANGFVCFLFAVVNFCFVGCNADIQEASRTEEIFGTIVSVKAYGINAEEAVFAAFNRAAELEKIFRLQFQIVK